MAFDSKGLESYNDVASRMAEFFAKHPEGSLQPLDQAQPFRVETVGDKTFVVYTAAAYRTPDDPRPGVGVAWEPFPGRTPYTRDSELQNAETSAWGRAILAVGAADTRKGVASREEVANRRADREDWDEATPAPNGRPTADADAAMKHQTCEQFIEQVKNATSAERIKTLGQLVKEARGGGRITQAHYDRISRAAAHRLSQLEQPEAVLA